MNTTKNENAGDGIPPGPLEPARAVTAANIVDELNIGGETLLGQRPYPREDGHIGFGASSIYVRYRNGKFTYKTKGIPGSNLPDHALRLCQGARDRLIARNAPAGSFPHPPRARA